MLGLFSKALRYFWRRAGDNEGGYESWAASGRRSRAGCEFPVVRAGAVRSLGAWRARGTRAPVRGAECRPVSSGRSGKEGSLLAVEHVGVFLAVLFLL